MPRYQVDVRSTDFGRATYVRVFDPQANLLIVGTFSTAEPLELRNYDTIDNPATTAFFGYEPAIMDAEELFRDIADALAEHKRELQSRTAPLELDERDRR